MSNAIKELTSQVGHLRVTMPNIQTSNIVVESMVYTNSNKVNTVPNVIVDAPSISVPQSITIPNTIKKSSGSSNAMAALRRKLIEKNRQRAASSGPAIVKPPVNVESKNARPTSSASQKAEVLVTSSQVAEALRQQRAHKVTTMTAKKESATQPIDS